MIPPLSVTIASETRDVAEVGTRIWTVTPERGSISCWASEAAAFAERDELAAEGELATVRVTVVCAVTDIPRVWP